VELLSDSEEEKEAPTPLCGVDASAAAPPPPPANVAAGTAWGQLLRGRGTNPVCKCGKVSVQQTVIKKGENLGRRFLVCPGGAGARCDFFRWI
jgi:rubredoxin